MRKIERSESERYQIERESVRERDGWGEDKKVGKKRIRGRKKEIETDKERDRESD